MCVMELSNKIIIIYAICMIIATESNGPRKKLAKG